MGIGRNATINKRYIKYTKGPLKKGCRRKSLVRYEVKSFALYFSLRNISYPLKTEVCIGFFFFRFLQKCHWMTVLIMGASFSPCFYYMVLNHFCSTDY